MRTQRCRPSFATTPFTVILFRSESLNNRSPISTAIRINIYLSICGQVPPTASQSPKASQSHENDVIYCDLVLFSSARFSSDHLVIHFALAPMPQHVPVKRSHVHINRNKGSNRMLVWGLAIADVHKGFGIFQVEAFGSLIKHPVNDRITWCRWWGNFRYKYPHILRHILRQLVLTSVNVFPLVVETHSNKNIYISSNILWYQRDNLGEGPLRSAKDPTWPKPPPACTNCDHRGWTNPRYTFHQDL